MNIKILKIFLLFIVIPNQIIANQEELKTYEFNHKYWMEIFLPGYNFYKMDQPTWGTFFLIMRVTSLYGIYYFHNQFIKYNSLYKSAQQADFFYGLGYSYYDPIKGGYKTTKEFFIESGRMESYRNLSFGIHVIFTIIGLYKGYIDSWEEYEDNAPVFQTLQMYNHLNTSETYLIFQFAIRQDF